MSAKFNDGEWLKIADLFDRSAEKFGLPKRRRNSVLICTFNIRELGAVKNRSPQSWQFLVQIIRRFDLIAIQEVLDDLSGLEHLLDLLGKDYGMVVSDVTGVKPGQRGNAERLGFLFNWKRIERTALASDITYDRSEIAKNLFSKRADFSSAWTAHAKKLKAWETKAAERKAAGRKKPSRPPIKLPHFVSFIRQPHYVSFRIPGTGGAAPYKFLVVNAHLLYGEDKNERKWEFDALIEWLAVRAKKSDRLYHPNLLLLGDCNLDFDDDVTVMRDEIDAKIKDLNKRFLKSKKAAKANFPMLTPHPKIGVLRTALRQKQTYDQIGLFARDPRLPTVDDNKTAGSAPDEYDYGVFNIADLIAQALHGKDVLALSAKDRKAIYAKAEYDISDHMPAWIRLAAPS